MISSIENKMINEQSFFLINALDLRGGAASASFRFYKWLGGYEYILH